MNSLAKRTTSVTECACSAKIGENLRMVSPPAVLEAVTRLGKACRRLSAASCRIPDADPHPAYEEGRDMRGSDIKMWVSA
jgi:hypothetical protein